MLEDVTPIIQHLQSLNIPERNIILFGRSIGSLHALHGVYRHPQLAGLIIESGVADITERFFQRVAPEELEVTQAEALKELKIHFDYVQKLGGFQGRTLIMHARFDELLDAHQAELLYAAAREPKQLKIFDRGGHNDIFYRNRSEYMQLVEAFLAEL
jgi:pimeloyl-ACP methyl ester carboxylesterase